MSEPTPTDALSDVAVVLIGRNEGQRLVDALAAIPKDVAGMVYVDSGSDDGSVAYARSVGAQVVELDMRQPFTAARARNAGVDHLRAHMGYLPDFVQFIDGDCALRPGWLQTARAFLKTTPQAAAACGRRREKAPDASFYNQLIDEEWDTPVGQAKACGGDVLMRSAAFEAVGGFNPTLIAGEEPELCVRLRQAGWTIWRLDSEMTLHDADLHRFGQWWNRARRCGFAFAQGAYMHGAPPERHKVVETRRAVLWGLVLPVVTVLISVLSWGGLLLLLLWPAQLIRLQQRGMEWRAAALMVVSKVAEGQGVALFWRQWLMGKQGKIIEYK